ncbi:MAG TPA: hypothetical protein VGV39_15180 [Mesorhizobium sp.]|jgi:transcriptional regulator with XRE-family HTH domain|uniref:hypothetical protein n=1 Tax=Mesorhizobium sp. TaxID=1871066 RepID=UPI002DDC9E73|nr:hypothetical protein [Mesorhizobium sp.]HEV2504420.1 hypothetical protein [Mesorhizobium sp.]
MTAADVNFDPGNIKFDVFALFLEARRIHRGLTPHIVAQEAGVAREAVERAARGRNPGEDEFFALATWMGEAPELFFRKGQGHG